MRSLTALLFLLFFNNAFSNSFSIAQQPLVGINLEGNNYWSKEYSFKNITNQVRALFPQKNGASWHASDPGSVVFGADGYPTRIASDHSARTLWDLPKGHAGGQYVLLWEGTGEIEMLFFKGNTVVSSQPGRIVFDLPVASDTRNRRGFDILSTEENDPVRNLRIVPVAQETAYTGGLPDNPFRSVLTDRWSKMQSYRYMDWAKTNNSTLSTWANRPKPSDFTQTDRGVAIEHQITHANVHQSHPWFNIPHLATDDYIEKMALLVRDTLDDGLVARIEYSNEVWNDSFTQAQYAATQASAEGIAPAHWYSKRSVEMFDIFENVFTHGGTNPEGMGRLVRVLAGQASYAQVATQTLSYNNAYLKTDALAIAPYFGDIPKAGPQANAWTNANWPERLLKVEAILETTKGHMDNHAQLLSNTADDQGNLLYSDIKLFAYEGGQGFVGANNTHGNAALTQLMQDLSGRPEMRQWYFDYLTHWDQIGGKDFMLFSSAGERSKWGSWGHYEYEGQPLSESPKMQGVFDFLASRNLAGDFDHDGDVDATDLNALAAAALAATTGPDDQNFDLNNDGIVTFVANGSGIASDSDYFLRTLLSTEYGDANLDGQVDILDFDLLGQGFQGAGTGWLYGDFNGSGGATDFVDFDLLSQFFAFSSSSLAIVPIPEPCSVSLSCFALSMLSSSRLVRSCSR